MTFLRAERHAEREIRRAKCRARNVINGVESGDEGGYLWALATFLKDVRNVSNV